MKPFVSAAFVVASAAVAGACYSHTREVVVREPTVATVTTTEMVPSNTPVAPVVGVSLHDGDDNPTHYAADVRAQMDHIEEHVRDGVRHGHVSPAAIDEVTSRRSYVEQLLSQYSADGRMSHHERHQVDRAVDDMRNIHDRFEMHGDRAIGGGPYFYSTP